MSLKPSPSFLKVVALMAVLAIGPATIYFLYTRTGGPESKNEMTFQKNLRYALMAGTDAVDLAPLTPWPWVTVCVLDARLTRSDLAGVTGFDYQHYGELHWLPLADYWTLLFIDAEREVSWGTARPVVPVRIPRAELADLALPAGAKGACAPRDGHRLAVTRRAAPVGTSPAVVALGSAGG
ncbi:MAG: hypothetical protein SFV21_21935 [Rhodospirillaceae bacterium]|nr:hypothetical protein [Rhodospirillaceae bacterium]